MAEKKSDKKIVALIDAHAVLHRAFHALPGFTSPKREPTGALYGFSAFVLKLIKDLNPDYIAACYDLPQPTFRHAAYENYKAKRPKMDDGLAKQINRSRDILNAFNIPIYDAVGFEADDALGTIVEQLSDVKNLKIIIATGDLDTLQLVKDDDVVIYTLSKGIQDTIIYDEKKVRERFGFGPEFITDFKALKGDPSDNIIGVPGIGDKTATELILKFGSVENLHKILKKNPQKLEEEGFKPRVVKILQENEEEALFSKTLAEIHKGAPIKFSLEKSLWKENFDSEKVKMLFLELGFKSLINRINVAQGQVAEILEKEKTDEFSYARFKDELPEKLFNEVEKPLSKILYDMRERGILIDKNCLKKFSEDCHLRLDELEEKIWAMAGEKFNINSPKQIGEIIFEKLNLGGKRNKKTATGAYSTDIAQLVKLKGQHPIIDEIISHRELSKLVSTYTDALLKLAVVDGRIHTTFNQMGTSTGRISSQDPNLQNIPIRTELGRNIRRAFVASKGSKLVAFDYSQVELRVAAILSGDKKLKEIFRDGEDVHTAVASEIFNVPFEKVDSEMRRRAKVVNFGIIYGMGVNALSQNLGCSREEASVFFQEYFNDFKGVAEYLDYVKNFARERGYTETLWGRKRFFPQINSPVDYIRKESERMATNAPIQGTAADFIKMAMVKSEGELEKNNLKDKARLLLQIHDELLYEIEDAEIARAIPIIANAMEGVYKGDVVLEVKISTGDNWGEMAEFAR